LVFFEVVDAFGLITLLTSLKALEKHERRGRRSRRRANEKEGRKSFESNCGWNLDVVKISWP
jgi:hypothetical protein